MSALNPSTAVEFVPSCQPDVLNVAFTQGHQSTLTIDVVLKVGTLFTPQEQASAPSRRKGDTCSFRQRDWAAEMVDRRWRRRNKAKWA
jgi:hypothetical protein